MWPSSARLSDADRYQLDREAWRTGKQLAMHPKILYITSPSFVSFLNLYHFLSLIPYSLFRSTNIMHASYLTVAFLAIGAIAAPAAPKPADGGFGQMTGSFPFNPTGPSSSEESGDDGFDNPFPQAMQALEQAETAETSSAASHVAMAEPTLPSKPKAEASSVIPDTPKIPYVKAEPTHSVHKLHPTPTSSVTKPSVESHVAAPTHAAMSFPAPLVSQGPAAAPTPAVSEPAMPSSSHSLIRAQGKSSSATPTSSATPSPSASAPAGPLGGLLEGLPLVGGMVGAPLAGLGLRR
ncbi:unnamed protein product [Penicillium bialowiezense]